MTFAPATIRVFDLETTGFPPDAEVIEITAVDVVTRPFALPLIAHSHVWFVLVGLSLRTRARFAASPSIAQDLHGSFPIARTIAG